MQNPLLSFIFGAVLGAGIVFTLYNTVLVDSTSVTYLPDGGQYTGERKGDLLHGKGRIEWPEGALYEGDFLSGKMEGRGVLHSPDGSVYEGEFKSGMLYGEGVYRWKSMTYTGNFKDNQFHGLGEQTLADGDRYVGEFKDGYYHGNGEYIPSEGGRYSGEFVQGAFTGQGTYEYPDGTVFVGTVKDWAMGGKGELTNSEGGKYAGDFSAGYLVGEGEYSSTDGSFYKGGFQYGMYHGEGEYTGADGSHYVGKFENGYYDGSGILKNASGDVYEGEFNYGRYHGRGALSFADPKDGLTQHSGVWKNGKLSVPDDPSLFASKQVIAEAVLYNQNQLLAANLNKLQPNNPDEVDLYFLGIASYGSEAVFRREVLFVKNYFDTKLNTSGRSAALINDRKSFEQYPLATQTSFEQSLSGFAEKMDSENDILFVFISTHGSNTFDLSINQPGLTLGDLSAEHFASALNAVPIKWKVIVVSACYSGGHIPFLANDHTLVITAAAKDKTSFGCSDGNEFTYFGEAYFKDALPESGSFVKAFDKARDIVEQRELAQDYEFSSPEISRPAAVLKQLEAWRAQIADY